MSNHNLSLELKQRRDVDGKVFYIGKLKGPFSINFDDGVVFLIFTSDKGEEQLQISPMDKKEVF